MIRILTISILLVMTTLEASAQFRNSRSENHFAIKNNIFGYIANEFHFSFEYQIKSNQSLQMVTKIFNRNESNWLNLSGNEDERIGKGFAVGIEYRIYLNSRADDLRGVYFSPYFRYFNKNITITPGYNSGYPTNDNKLEYKRTMNSGGIMFGIQGIVPESGVGIDCFLGIGVRTKTDSNINGNLDLYYKPLNLPELRFGLNILFSNA